jgi:LPXTG-motif cell wall-anchored protein
VGESSILSKLSENMQIAIAAGIPALLAFIFGIFYFRIKRKTH